MGQTHEYRQCNKRRFHSFLQGPETRGGSNSAPKADFRQQIVETAATNASPLQPPTLLQHDQPMRIHRGVE
jgi:hypothetical protein